MPYLVYLEHKACPVCGKQFQRPAEVVRHMRRHTGEKPFSCTICGKVFTRKSTLKTHVQAIHVMPGLSVSSVTPTGGGNSDREGSGSSLSTEPKKQ